MVATFPLAISSPASAATYSIPLHMVGTSTKTVPVNVGHGHPARPGQPGRTERRVLPFDPDCPNGIWGVGVDVQDVDIHVQFTQDVGIDASDTDGLLSEGKTLDVVDAVTAADGHRQGHRRHQRRGRRLCRRARW